LAGAGLDNHIDWLRSVPTSAPTPISIAGLTGLPPLIVAMRCAIIALRSWRWAVVGLTLATPAVYLYTFGLLSLLLVPTQEHRDVVGRRPDGSAIASNARLRQRQGEGRAAPCQLDLEFRHQCDDLHP
jgi:hypothetical protein